MIVAKSMEFCAAHYLPNYEGKCSQMHGHTWKVELAVKGEVDEETGMVVDFTEIKAFLDGVKDKFDHTLLNDIIPNPTAENICLWIKDELGSMGKIGGNIWLELAWIKVWEAADSYAMVEG